MKENTKRTTVHLPAVRSTKDSFNLIVLKYFDLQHHWDMLEALFLLDHSRWHDHHNTVQD